LHDDLETRAVERAAKLTAEIAMRERLQRELLHISEREQERVGQISMTALSASDRHGACWPGARRKSQITNSIDGGRRVQSR